MKIDKIQLICLLFMLACVANIVFATKIKESAILDALYYIKEHLFIISLLFIVAPLAKSSIGVLTVYGLIVYKFELVIFNVMLAFKTKSEFDALSQAYDYTMIFTGSIWLIILICLIVKKYL